MALRINQNATALMAYSNLSSISGSLEKSIAKLSSGLRINSAADDAAGLAISEKMRSQIRGLNRAKLNAQDGISMLQVAEGGLNESESIIQRMRELAIQASNDTLTSNDRLEIQKEINQLRDSLNDIANSTEYNTKKLLNGNQTAQISASSKYVSGVVTGSGSKAGDYRVSMSVVEAGISQIQSTQVFLDKNTGKLASGSTKLEDIEQFYDENGVFALSVPQTLTVNGNSESSQLTIDGKMTLNQLAAALQNSIASSSGLGIKNSSATVVSTVQSGVSGLGGYIELTSGKIGESGDFSIAGDQAVMDALGLSVTRQSANNIVQARIQDSNGNVRTVNTSTDNIPGLINGTDIKFDSTPAQIAGKGGIVEGLNFASAETLSFNFNVGNTNVPISVTLNGKYSMEGIAAEINKAIQSDATAKDQGMLASVVDGQIRLAYNPVDSNSSTTINITSDCPILGFTQGSFEGFVDGDKDRNETIKGISLLDSTSGTNRTISIGDGTLSHTFNIGTTMTAGADLVEINETLISVNGTLSSLGINARMDAINGSVAFTSTILGKRNNNGSPATVGNIVVSGAGGMDTVLGFKSGTAKGTGESNFRLHIVSTNPSFQIGANEGQTMGVSIGNMTAGALGIDKLDMSTTAGAQKALAKIDSALSRVSSERSKIGAFSNRLSFTINNLENTATNLSDAESRIRDVDYAQEMINFTSQQIKQQAATAMLAQANSMSSSILQLLQG
jgi:flagellin